VPEIEFGEYKPVSAEIEQYLLRSASRQPAASGIPGWITEQQYADQIGVSLATVRRWRRQHYGPTFVKIGRRDYCRENAAAEFAADQLKKAESAAEPRPRGRPRRR
jgi:hypothetical protein